MTINVGFSRTEIHCFVPGIGMMGYGRPHNIVQEVATPLYARVVIFEDKNHSAFIFINLELAFVSIAVKEEVTQRLKILLPQWDLDLSKIMITSQHTHSAPGGYGHHPFYNFTIPGFRPQIFEAVVRSCVEGALEASKNLSASLLKLGSFDIPLDQEVAFNRSMKAYQQNPEATTSEKAQAINRKMEGLSIFSPTGELRAHLNWFGVHATSVSSYNQRIHHDNKGLAAASFESSHPGVLAIFAQAAAGDVSPNYIWDKKLGRMRGKFSDQYESAAFNGELQKNAALKISAHLTIEGEVECAHLYADLSRLVSTPAHGVDFFQGTLEGPGISPLLGSGLRFISRLIRASRLIFNPEAHADFYHSQGKKDIVLDHRNGEFLGIPLHVMKLLPFSSPDLGSLISDAKSGALETLPWVPPTLPHQLVKIGSLILVGVPGEITTIAAQRLKESLQQKFPAHHLIISSYANAYMGYITTPEEYDLQCYEGGHTVYGRNTLPAFIKGFEALSELMLLQQKPTTNISPLYYPASELKQRTIEP